MEKENIHPVKKEKDLEKRSEEVTDIIERMPMGFTRIAAIVTVFVVSAMLLLGLVISYPDTVVGQISITGEKAPVRLVSPTSGRLRLLKENMSNISEGDCIGYIDNGSGYDDILQLHDMCDSLDLNSGIALPENLRLGSLSPYYNEFRLSYFQYHRLLSSGVYRSMRKALADQRLSCGKVADNIAAEIRLNETVLSNLTRQYAADSQLLIAGAVSKEELESRHNGILSQRQVSLDLRSSELAKLSDAASAGAEMARLDLNRREEIAAAYSSMMSKYDLLRNELRLWTENYLFVSPISGVLEYLGFWRENQHVSQSEEVFSVSPDSNALVGELLIPSQGAGKVMPGQSVNVKLLEYPYDEFGYLRGKVESVSALTRKIPSSDAVSPAYMVKVRFPEGMLTNYGVSIRPNYESLGTGEIITEERRLIGRLFDNLKSGGNK